MALAGAVLFTLAPGAVSTVDAAEPKTEAQQIIKIAKAQMGDPWRHGARGPRAFDCSGLVIYAYTKAGDAKAVGKGKLRSARALYHWYKARGLASRSNPKVGDLVIWGGGTHVGIYIGKGKAISTLTSGVRVHGVHAVRASFTAYLHTGMSKKLTPAGKAAVAKAKAKAAATAAESARRVGGARDIGEVIESVGFVPLRSGPTKTADVLATLKPGTSMTVLDTARGDSRWWLQVRTASTTGWLPTGRVR